MIEINNPIYNCESCGHANNYNKKTSELIDGINYNVVQCYYCDLKYKMVNGYLHALPRPIKEVPKKAASNDKGNTQIYIIMVVAVIGGLILGLFGTDWITKPFNSLTSNEVTQSVTPVVPQTSPPITTQKVSPVTAVPSGNVTSTQQPENAKVTSCNFDLARSKALSKLDRMNYHYVTDKFEPEKDLDMCRVKYHFYVKQRKFDLEGNPYIDDKIFELDISYNKLGDDFEYMGGFFYDPATNRGGPIN